MAALTHTRRIQIKLLYVSAPEPVAFSFSISCYIDGLPVQNQKLKQANKQKRFIRNKCRCARGKNANVHVLNKLRTLSASCKHIFSKTKFTYGHPLTMGKARKKSHRCEQTTSIHHWTVQICQWLYAHKRLDYNTDVL